jgi:hypothetical protein
MPKLVIGRPFVGIGEHLVGFVYFLEPFLSPIVTVAVRVVLKGQLAKSPPDFFIGGVFGHAQNLVVIPFCGHVIYLLLSAFWEAGKVKVCLEKSIPQKGTTTYMVLTRMAVVKESAARINLGPKNDKNLLTILEHMCYFIIICF